MNRVRAFAACAIIGLSLAIILPGCDNSPQASAATSPGSGSSPTNSVPNPTAGTTTPTDASANSPATETSADEYVVGHYASMTGSEATFGKSTDDGIKLAIEEINAAGGVKGKKFRLITYDDQGKGQEAATAVTRLITRDKVVAVLGEVASSRSIAGGQVAQQNGVPMITPSSTNASVTEIGDMISRVCFIDPFQGFVCAKFVRDNLKLSTAATLYDRTQAYSAGLNDDFKKAFTELGGKIVTEQAYAGGDADFSAQLTNIRDKNPDVIFIPGYYTEAGNIAMQVRKLGLKSVLIGGDGWDSAKLAEIGGQAIEGAYYSNHYSDEEQRPAVQDFVKKYKEKYGAVPDGLAALGYDAMRLLADAMTRAKSTSGKDLAEAINSTKDFAGVTGVITIDAERNARKPAVILKMQGGRPRYAATIQPK
ncbi:MAG: ABC transporter substrate-binding protein [Phycisphaerales bacterium]|nr:ABC transporter substrate-binding protein [Phycisphaerales bacterium]